MKYFTPDLLARFGSSDEAVADAAEKEWDGKQKEYRKYLQSISARDDGPGFDLRDRLFHENSLLCKALRTTLTVEQYARYEPHVRQLLAERHRLAADLGLGKTSMLARQRVDHRRRPADDGPLGAAWRPGGPGADR
jgi:hypothetical protein